MPSSEIGKEIADRIEQHDRFELAKRLRGMAYDSYDANPKAYIDERADLHAAAEYLERRCETCEHGKTTELGWGPYNVWCTEQFGEGWGKPDGHVCGFWCAREAAHE